MLETTFQTQETDFPQQDNETTVKHQQQGTPE